MVASSQCSTQSRQLRELSIHGADPLDLQQHRLGPVDTGVYLSSSLILRSHGFKRCGWTA